MDGLRAGRSSASRPERPAGAVGARPLAAALLALALLATGACVSYRPAPLPEASVLASAPTPDLERLRVEAAELVHPRLEPLAIDLADGLSPDEAAVLAVLANPDLAAARMAHGETAAQLVVAGLLPAPSWTLEGDRPYGSGSAGTVDVVNLGLELDLGELIQRSARIAEAAATLEAVDLGIAWQEWQVAQAARLEAQRIGWLRRRIAVSDTELSAEGDTLEVLRSAMATGDATLPDVGVQLASVEGLRRSRGELRRAEIEARGELDRLLGLPGTSALPVTLAQSADRPAGELARGLGADALVGSAVERRLDLTALRRGYDAQEAVVRAAVLAQLPSLSVGVVHQRNESALRFLGGYVTLGLPIFGRARAAITREEGTRARLGEEIAARSAGVRAEVVALLAVLDELEGEIGRASEAVERLEPVATAERDAAARGDVDRLSEQVVRIALSEARLELAALGQARAETLVGLETAVGSPLRTLASGDPGGRL